MGTACLFGPIVAVLPLDSIWRVSRSGGPALLKGHLMNLDFSRLGDCRPSLGEGPVWDDRRHCLFFVDIRAPAVHAIRLDGSGFRTWPMPSLTGSIGLAESGRIIVALQHAVAILDPDSGDLQPLIDIRGEPARNRLNDGKVGPDGAFWVGSMDMQHEGRKPTGSLYRIDGRGRLSVARPHCVAVSNGLAWSGDGRTMFHADSHQGCRNASSTSHWR